MLGIAVIFGDLCLVDNMGCPRPFDRMPSDSYHIGTIVLIEEHSLCTPSRRTVTQHGVAHYAHFAEYPKTTKEKTRQGNKGKGDVMLGFCTRSIQNPLLASSSIFLHYPNCLTVSLDGLLFLALTIEASSSLKRTCHSYNSATYVFVFVLSRALPRGVIMVQVDMPMLPFAALFDSRPIAALFLDHERRFSLRSNSLVALAYLCSPLFTRFLAAHMVHIGLAPCQAPPIRSAFVCCILFRPPASGCLRRTAATKELFTVLSQRQSNRFLFLFLSMFRSRLRKMAIGGFGNGNTEKPGLAWDYSHFKRQYKLGAELGRGGFGTVYCGFRMADNMTVACKYVARTNVTEWACVSLVSFLYIQGVLVFTVSVVYARDRHPP
uniref:Protein kinase domain-containing protein n=1 Tax=Heterorhabditis bacteriophora TaxID=37862 RepID=A0A1I7X9S6_HETBA